MLAKKTKGFENGQNVEIYLHTVISNQGDIDIAKTNRLPKDQVPKPETLELPYIIAGSPQGKSQYNGPLRDKHIKSFPKTHAAFLAGKDSTDEKGISLDELHGIPASILESFTEQKIDTLEKIVGINDSDIESFPMGRQIQEQAKRIIALVNEEQTDDNSEKIEELMGAFESFKEETEAKQAEAAEENKTLAEQLAAANKRAEEAEAALEEKPADAKKAPAKKKAAAAS